MPWLRFLPEGYETTVDKLKKAYDAPVVWRKEARNTYENGFGVRRVESSEVGESSCRTGVRISDVIEAGQVEYLSETLPVAPLQ